MSLRRGGIALGLALAATAAGLIAWNTSRFIGAESRPRTKDITFLPPPVLAEALVLGHRNSAAKLRWIDSTAYLQYQFEHRDDRVANGGAGAGDTRGGFERLYETLIRLDPWFSTYYEHGFLATDALASRPQAALALIGQGLIQLPDSSLLWKLWAVHLVTRFTWEERQPQAFQAMLAGWYASESTDNGKRLVLDWSRGLAIRRFKGLEAVPWWRAQIEASKPGTPNAEFAERTLRELLSRWCQVQWEALAALHRERHGRPPAVLDDLCADDLVRAHWPDGVPTVAPVEPDGPGRWRARTDPLGFPFVCADGAVTSIGSLRSALQHQLPRLRNEAAALIAQRGRPGRLDDLVAWGLQIPVTGQCALDEQGLPVLKPLDHVPIPWPVR